MSNIVRFPGSDDGGSDGGPEDPMLGQRVARLEEDMKEVRGDVRNIRDRLGVIEECLARIEGGFTGINAKLDALPTVWTFVVALVGSVIAAVAIAVSLAP